MLKLIIYISYVGKIMTRFNGITWTSRNDVSNNNWNLVAYNNGLWVS